MSDKGEFVMAAIGALAGLLGAGAVIAAGPVVGLAIGVPLAAAATWFFRRQPVSEVERTPTTAIDDQPQEVVPLHEPPAPAPEPPVSAEPSPVVAKALAPPAPPSRDAFYGAAIRPSLRQTTLALDQLARAESSRLEAGTSHAPSPFHQLAQSATNRAQEALTRLELGEAAVQRDPFPLREDLALVTRAIAHELGRDIAIRFSTSFPAQAIGDRTAVRMALSILLHEAVRGIEDETHELLVEANHEDIASQRALIRVVVDARPQGLQAPPPPPFTRDLAQLPHPADPADPNRARMAHPILGPLAELLKKAGATSGRAVDLLASDDLRRLGFELPVARFKRLTGTTLYGVGALSDRKAIVVDPRPFSRVSICESIASWRLEPTTVSTVAEALPLLAAMKTGGPRFDVVVIAISELDDPHPLEELATHRTAFTSLPILTLENLDSLAAPLPPALAGHRITRIPRPVGMNEFLEALTLQLAPPLSTRPTRKKAESGLSVLVAEDNPVNQALIVKLLERRGVSVVLANNGADLVDRLLETPDAFDAVLMDLQMPVMDGYESTAVIRLREAQAERRRLPIIAVTAHALGGERERCIEAGMDAYLSKPIAERELFEVLDSVTAKRPEPVSAAARESEVFDVKRVLEFAAGDREFLENLVALLKETAPKQLEVIDAALRSNDSQAVFRSAHQLKGTVGNFAAKQALSLAGKLEDLGRNQDLAGGNALLTDLRAEVGRLLSALDTMLAQLP